MKDSQLDEATDESLAKYIKADNERFSTQLCASGCSG